MRPDKNKSHDFFFLSFFSSFGPHSGKKFSVSDELEYISKIKPLVALLSFTKKALQLASKRKILNNVFAK